MGNIRFKFSAQKARAALHWMLAKAGDIDLHAALKACYFADKAHLNKFHRPIFGATYKAMKFGLASMKWPKGRLFGLLNCRQTGYLGGCKGTNYTLKRMPILTCQGSHPPTARFWSGRLIALCG